MKKTSIILLIASCLLINSVKAQLDKVNNDSKYPGYTKSEFGYYYKFLKKNENAQKPEIGDVITIGMIYKTNKDSTLFSSYTDVRTKGQPLKFPLGNAVYKGDFIEGITLMGIGDSASFITSADSFFLKLAQFPELPPFIQAGSDLTFTVKLISILKKVDFEKQQQEMIKQYTEKIEKLKKEEPDKIKKYLDSNKIKVKPAASGLYYKETVKGKGPKAENGDTVSVHYTGKFLDGSVFDSSIGKDPIKFPLGAGYVIKGWDEGIGLMKKGSKGILIIPSSLAYADKGAGQIIPPYTPLIFEVEIINIIKVPKKK